MRIRNLLRGQTLLEVRIFWQVVIVLEIRVLLGVGILDLPWIYFSQKQTTRFEHAPTVETQFGCPAQNMEEVNAQAVLVPVHYLFFYRCRSHQDRYQDLDEDSKLGRDSEKMNSW